MSSVMDHMMPCGSRLLARNPSPPKLASRCGRVPRRGHPSRRSLTAARFYLTTALRTLLTTQLTSVATLKQQGTITPYVFHYPDGARIRDIRKQWEKACEVAGYPGKLLHDMRRSAVRTLERSGVPRSTAMAMVGHKTESIYKRYAIVDDAMHREAAAKLDAYAMDQQAAAKGKKRGQVRRFKSR
jgi:integrase